MKTLFRCSLERLPKFRRHVDVFQFDTDFKRCRSRTTRDCTSVEGGCYLPCAGAMMVRDEIPAKSDTLFRHEFGT